MGAFSLIVVINLLNRFCMIIMAETVECQESERVIQNGSPVEDETNHSELTEVSTNGTVTNGSDDQLSDQVSEVSSATSVEHPAAANGQVNGAEPALKSNKGSNKTTSKKGHPDQTINGETPAFGRNIEAATKSMLKALSQLETPEEKIAALCSRYADLLGEHKQLQNYLKDTTKSQQQLQKEKDRLQADHNKTLLTKERLESLCRELQKQNKKVKEESLKRSLEEQTKIREVSERFQSTISEVQTSMSENSEKNDRLKEENEQLCAKIKALIQQYEKREEYVEKLTKTKEMERQLVEAKLKESGMVLAEEREQSLIEKQKLLSDNVEMRQRCETLMVQLEASKTKDKMYAEKFDEFESTLSKSNEMFNTFKTEMDKTSKRIKSLEKETQMWKAKFDGANQSLVTIMEERIAKERELTACLGKTQKLEKLCRALQEERNSLSEKNRKIERINQHLKIKCGEIDADISTDQAANNTKTNAIEPNSNKANSTDKESQDPKRPLVAAACATTDQTSTYGADSNLEEKTSEASQPEAAVANS